MSAPPIIFLDGPGGITAKKLNLKFASIGGGTGTGDMTKAVYDTNNNGVVDQAESIPWSGISGKPTTFPPDSTAMLKSVYDVNANSIVDAAESVPWTGVTGKPTTFPPSTHAPTHLDNGTDVIPVVTATRTGLTPKLSGNAGTYLDGTGVFSAPPGTVSPGTWTNLTYAIGWSQSVTAQFRVETNGSFQTVICKGAILQAAGAANSAFTFPVGARPSAVRNLVLGGQQQADTVDVVLYHCNVDTTGAVTIYAMVKHSFVWPIEADAQLVYLDGLRFEL